MQLRWGRVFFRAAERRRGQGRPHRHREIKALNGSDGEWKAPPILPRCSRQIGRCKERQGDHKTPVGQYVIDQKNAQSRFHLALHVSYPNAADRKRAHDAGVDPGGAIMARSSPA